ncbi:MAG: NVEALA domain-containing protein [Tannerella sp.]|jgi:hypothetical protein|nr:NVEALA domain-containing protein [Tannerella sp.]
MKKIRVVRVGTGAKEVRPTEDMSQHVEKQSEMNHAGTDSAFKQTAVGAGGCYQQNRVHEYSGKRASLQVRNGENIFQSFKFRNRKKTTKIISGSVVAAIFATIVAINVNFHYLQNSKLSEIALANVEALAGSENNNLWSGYLNQTRSCRISETAYCSITIYIPACGYCSVGFNYTIKHEGTENPCMFTGNPQTQCDYYQCRRNV